MGNVRHWICRHGRLTEQISILEVLQMAAASFISFSLLDTSTSIFPKLFRLSVLSEYFRDPEPGLLST